MKSFLIVLILIGKAFRFSFTSASLSRFSFPEYVVPGSRIFAGVKTSVRSSFHSVFPRNTGSNMNSPAGVCLFAFTANPGVKRISIVELTDTIPDVYPVMYSLNPLSMGTIRSPVSCFFRMNFTGAFSLFPHEEIMASINTGSKSFAAFIISDQII